MTLGNEYDELPYESHAYAQTHPDHIGAVGRLVGLDCPSLERSRVLELGCGEGGNLIPMAWAAPGGQYVGVDLSGRQIEVARDEANRLGLDNVTLHHASITDLDPDNLGKFDYVICHGLYSWVPEPVREAILRVTGAVLADHGVAYLSYNAKPGWSMRTAIREMMQFHIRHRPDYETRVLQARAVLAWLSESWGETTGLWPDAVRAEAARIEGVPDWYLMHDNLAAVNLPFWLHEVVAAAEKVGLQYLGDAVPMTMFAENYPKGIAEVVTSSGADQWVVEQYFDFATFRGFRHTLLWSGHAEIDRRLLATKLDGIRLLVRAAPEGDADLAEGVEVTFKNAEGQEVTVADAAIKAMMMFGVECGPRAATVDEVTDWVARRVDLPNDADLRRKVAVNLLHGVARGVVAPRLDDRPFAHTPGERPLALPYARRQVQKGLRAVTSYLHDHVPLAPFDREVITACDGQRDRDGIVDFLFRAVGDGRIEVAGPNGPFRSADEARAGIRTGLESALTALGHKALFLA